MPRPGFTFLVCPDTELAKRRFESLLAEHPPAAGGMGSTGSWERKVFWGDEGLGDAFWQALTLNDLFGKPKALVVRNAQNLKKEEWQQLSGPLSRFNEQAWPFFFLEVAYERKKFKVPAEISKTKFYTFAQKKGWIWESQGLGEQGVRQWLQSWAKEKGFSFQRGALEILCASMPPDAAAVASELEKLELALEPGAAISPDIAGLISFTPDIDIFAFIDALQKPGGAGTVWSKVLGQQLAGKGFLFQFLSLLVREARFLWQLAHGEEAKGLPFFKQNERQQLARQLGGRRIARIWDAALEAELRVKTGEAGEDQAMELLIAELSAIFRPEAPVAGQGQPRRYGPPPRPGRR